MTSYNERLDEILTDHREWMRGIRTDRLVGTASEATKQALLDWHNKQVEAELEALREEIKHEDMRTISQVITARIDKLKESGNDKDS